MKEGILHLNSVDIRHGDCLDVLRGLPGNSVDSIVTDPPYGLSNTKPAQVADVLAAWVTGETEAVPAKKGGFMGKDWDSFVPPPAVWEECLRVLKPGGHMAVFAGARTQDLMGLSIRLAGFEIRDTLGWIYGSGFPKSMDVGKAIDKAAGAEREVIGVSAHSANRTADMGYHGNVPDEGQRNITAPATDDAARWDGWGTALKPAIEPIILARKPLVGTVAQNVLEHGVGGLNIDACRIEGEANRPMPRAPQGGILRLHGCHTEAELRALAEVGGKTPDGRDARATLARTIADRERYESSGEKVTNVGRFPANVLLDEHAATEMDKQSGVLKSGGYPEGGVPRTHNDIYGKPSAKGEAKFGASEGGASRFFPVFKYQAKAPKRERPVIEREDGTKVQHPTVKPLALLDWLVTLTTPPGGLVLDPFAGSGTTLQAARDKGFRAIGVEQDPDYIRLINARLETAAEDGGLF